MHFDETHFDRVNQDCRFKISFQIDLHSQGQGAEVTSYIRVCLHSGNDLNLKSVVRPPHSSHAHTIFKQLS